MATFLDCSISPRTAKTFSFQEGTSAHDFTHLSGATLLELANNQENDVPTTSAPQTRPYYQPTRLRHTSVASTTKSDLRRSDDKLADMLRSIQAELAMQREIMLDVQARVSSLEQQSNNINYTKPGREADPSHDSTSRASALTRESRTWWEACQNFAHNCDTPFPATEFLATPRRFSGFDFNFSTLKTSPPPAEPKTPEVDDVPSLTPGSEHDEHSKASTPERCESSHPARPSSTPKPTVKQDEDVSSDIVERILHFDKVKIPQPPILQSPPRNLRSKETSSSSYDENITALPVMPLRPVTMPVGSEKGVRQHIRIRSLFTYKALLKGKAEERETNEGSRRLYVHR